VKNPIAGYGAKGADFSGFSGGKLDGRRWLSTLRHVALNTKTYFAAACFMHRVRGAERFEFTRAAHSFSALPVGGL
jgi:hypothetical protein